MKAQRSGGPFVVAILIIFYCVAVSSKGYAQGLSSIDLKTLQDEALHNNPEIQAARERWQAARSRVPQASALPDPQAGYSFMGPDLMTTRGPEKEIYEFEQMVPFPGKLVAKRNIAKSELAVAQAQLNSVERDVVLQVSQAYYDLYAVELSLKITEEVKELLSKFESVAESRYASAGGAQREVSRAQAEVSEMLKKIFVLRQERESLLALLTSLLNRVRPLSIEFPQEISLPDLNQSLDELLSLAREHRPELKEAKAMEKKEQHAQSLAKLDNVPDVSVGFQYYRIGKGQTSDPEDGQDAWMIPVKVTIPLWQNRISAEISEARSNLKAAQSRLKSVENVTDYEIKNAYHTFNSKKQIVELYRNAFIPQAELAFRSDQAGYEAGKMDAKTFIDSERVYLNAKMGYYQALSEALKSLAALKGAVGKDLVDEGGRS